MNRSLAAPTRAEHTAATAAAPILQRQCACGTHTPSGGECTSCAAKKRLLQRRAAFRSEPEGAVAPPIVHEVLRRPGRPLDEATRAYFEPRCGHDFSHVRVHTDARAAESAAAVNALAYTVGHDVVFGAGQFAPHAPASRRLMTHELTHVVQQGAGNVGAPQRSALTIGGTSDLREREADRAAETIVAGVNPAHPRHTLSTPILQRQEGETAQPSAGTETLGAGQQAAPPAPLTEVRPREQPAERVQRIVISCADMRLRLETASTSYIYGLDECEMPLGSYDANVTITENDFDLDFPTVPEDQAFSFRYRVEPGQENPATFLREQATVRVDIVARVPSTRETRLERPRTPQCVIRLRDRELVPANSASRNLFNPLSFGQEIWSHTIPLGQFGWVDVAATASGNLSGTLSGSYGPGRLTDNCLMHLVERTASSAPIERPLLGRCSRADVTSYTIGGRARFSLPARAAVRILAQGRLRINGELLSDYEVAAAEGALTARGEATLAGSINGSVEILARATQAQATLEDNLLPLELVIERSTIDSVDLAAEIGLRGRAGIMIQVDLSAGFDLLGVNLWRQTWPLVQFDAGIAWSGGLKYSPNPGIHWNLGVLGIGDEDFDEESEHEDAAEVEEEDIIKAILKESQATVASPDGLSERNALPFDWYKPDELYAPSVILPNADPPAEVNRLDGPTPVGDPRGGRTISAR